MKKQQQQQDNLLFTACHEMRQHPKSRLTLHSVTASHSLSLNSPKIAPHRATTRNAWEKIRDWGLIGWGLKMGKQNYFMLIGFEMTSIYIIKMQIDTFQHTHTHTLSRTGGSVFSEGWRDRRRRTYKHTYQERKCHLLARPASQ